MARWFLAVLSPFWLMTLTYSQHTHVFDAETALHGEGPHERSYNEFRSVSGDQEFAKIRAIPQFAPHGFHDSGFHDSGFHHDFHGFFSPPNGQNFHLPQQQHPNIFPQQQANGFLGQTQAYNPFSGFGGSGPAAPAPPVCPVTVVGPCNNGKYRTFDGSCNNLRNPNWGMAMTTYNRLAPPKYADGIQVPAVSVTGSDLPPARIVSALLFPDADIPDPKWTLAAMQYGQIITHDMSLALGTTQSKPHATKCCSNDGREVLLKDTRSPTCYPIEVPHDDPVYAKSGRRCLNFVRSTSDINQGCNTGGKPAEQIVAVTHYLDLSLVYGPNQMTADSLRVFQGGLLRTETRHGGKLYPPPATNKTASCDQVEESEPCYLTGDARANQNPQLTIFQILLLREHNRIATALSQINPHWPDETLYQEARRITIAQHQQITYYEWLPIFLGWENLKRHGVVYETTQHSGSYTGDYNDNVDASVLNGHATAAFRYFHTNIAGFLHLVSEHRQGVDTLRLSDHFNRPQVLEQGNNFDGLIRGMATQSQQTTDQFFTSEITKFLFRNGMPLGSDLRALDIQRGRDHGLASYNEYRVNCGLNRARSFDDFADLISRENIQKLSRMYASPEDVDFTVAGSLEAHVEGALAGPTFLCVLTEQFYRTRVGDRFFYENGERHHSFSADQLREVRKASISRLFCDNGDNIQAMQPLGFLKISPKNSVVPCNRIDVIPVVNLELWREIPNHGFHHFKK